MSYIDRRYLKTPSGLIHLREIGDGPTLLLVHGNPWSGAFWEPVMPLFAAAGFRAVAFDALGFGLSDRAGHALTVDEQADVMAEVVCALGEPIIGVVGWHQGGVTGIAFGVRYPALCNALVLDGASTATDAQAVELMAKVAANKPSYPFEGHERSYWSEVSYGRLKVFNPHFELSGATWPIFRRFLMSSMQVEIPPSASTSPMVPESVRPKAGAQDTKSAVPHYPWLANLKRLTIPALILSADDEPLRCAHEAACAAAPHAANFVYPQGHPLIGVGRESEYIVPIVKFLSALPHTLARSA